MVDATEEFFPGWDKLMGDDLLLKTLEKPTQHVDQEVQPQDVVSVDIEGRLANSPDHEDGPVFLSAREWLVTIGEKDVLPALEMGIRFMKNGETAAIWSTSKFAYGPGQRRMVDGEGILPPNSSVRYTVVLRSILEETSEPSVQLSICESRKDIGNDVYKNDFIQSDPYAKSRALNLYKRSVEVLDHVLQQRADDPCATSTESTNTTLIDCLNNIAAVHLTCKSYHAAKEACVKVLERDPDNTKALLRAAKAALEDPASSFEEVEAAIVAAEENGTDTSRLRDLLHRRKASHAKRSKKLYSSMAKGMVKRTQTELHQPQQYAGDVTSAPVPSFASHSSLRLASFFFLVALLLLGTWYLSSMQEL